MRKLPGLALAVAVARCASSGGTVGHGSGHYPARGETWVGTGLASLSADTGPKLTAAPTGVSDLQIGGQTAHNGRAPHVRHAGPRVVVLDVVLGRCRGVRYPRWRDAAAGEAHHHPGQRLSHFHRARVGLVHPDPLTVASPSSFQGRRPCTTAPSRGLIAA